MKTESSSIDRERLAETIHVAYGLEVTALRFLPKGEDAFCYVADGNGGERHFARVAPSSEGTDLETAYQATHALHAQGLTRVVAARTTRGGRFTCRFGDFTLAVFPYIEGRTAYDAGISDDGLAQAAVLIASVHRSAEMPGLPSLPREDFAPPFEGAIARALQSAAQPSPEDTAIQAETRRLLVAEADDLRQTLRGIGAFEGQARGLDIPSVLTHGDPNLDNLLMDAQGTLHLTDWGEIGFGPPERDLFAFTGARFPAFLTAYRETGGESRLHLPVFRYYFYRWSLQEVADYTRHILFPSEGAGAAEEEHAWQELQPYLPLRHDEIARELEEVRDALSRT